MEVWLDGNNTTGYAYQEERASGAATARAIHLVGKHYEDTPSAQVRVKRYYAGGTLLAARQTNYGPVPGTEVTYVQGDHLGSSNTLTNGFGAVVGRERYSAFGERRRSDNAAVTDQLYTGQRLNVLSGLYHYSDGTSAGRFYDPLLARFVQADSVTPGNTSIALNRYAYANNSPIVFSDPSGHAAWKDEYEGDYGSPAQGFVPYAQDYNEWYYGAWEQAHGPYQGVDSDPYLNNPSYTNEGYPSADGLANSVSAVASRRANQRVLDEAAAGYVSPETIHGAAIAAGPALIGAFAPNEVCRDCGTARPNLARSTGRLRIDEDGASVFCEVCLKEGRTNARRGNDYRIRSFEEYEAEAQATGVGTPQYSPEHGGPGHFSVFRNGPTDTAGPTWMRLNDFIRGGWKFRLP